MAIIRYLARKHGLYAKNELDLVRIELAEGQANDLRLSIAPVCHRVTKEQHEQLRQARLEELPNDLEVRVLIAQC